jgi:hypothetical protein
MDRKYPGLTANADERLLAARKWGASFHIAEASGRVVAFEWKVI